MWAYEWGVQKGLIWKINLLIHFLLLFICTWTTENKQEVWHFGCTCAKRTKPLRHLCGIRSVFAMKMMISSDDWSLFYTWPSFSNQISVISRSFMATLMSLAISNEVLASFVNSARRAMRPSATRCPQQLGSACEGRRFLVAAVVCQHLLKKNVQESTHKELGFNRTVK